MSQRLLISKKENVNLEKDTFYDCIYTEDSTLKDLLDDWCCYDPESRISFGPWKIRIRDECLMSKFLEDFKQISNFVPQLGSLDDVWGIYQEDGVSFLNEDGTLKA